MKKVKFFFAAAALVSLFATTGCSHDDDNGPSQGDAHMKVALTDAPGDYDQVNVDITDIMIKANADAGGEGWVSIGNFEPGVYNLLDLTGGVTLLLADGDVPAGHLGQIRLMLGDDNTVVKNGVTYQLHTPSAQQSGLKLQVNQNLEAGATYNFLLDFDVHNSVVAAGNSGNYNLHPVLRVTTEESSGAIEGTVSNPEIAATASVMVGTTLVSADTDANGHFFIHGLPSGTYTVLVTPATLSGLPVFTLETVTVANGEVTDVGSITL